MTKLCLIQKTVCLTCTWVSTGDPKMPLACVWRESNTLQVASTSSSTDDTWRTHLCA